MAVEVNIVGGAVDVKLTAGDRVFAGRGHLEIPIQAIRRVWVADAKTLRADVVAKVYGAGLGSIVKIGRFYGTDAKSQLWAAGKGSPLLAMDLDRAQAEFDRLVFEVAAPAAVAKKISATLGQAKTT